MQSGYKITWTGNALKDLEKILNYLENNWSEKEIRKFFRKLENRIKLISTNPKIFPKTQIKEDVRKSVLTKQNTIYYKFENNYIIILTIFDTRQQSSKLKL